MALDINATAVRFLNQFADFPDTGTKNNHAADGSIACPMLMEVDIELTDATWDNGTLIFNPALFCSVQPQAPFDVNTGYGLTFGTSPTGLLALNLYTGSAGLESQRNEACLVEITSSTQATIHFRFLLTMDLGNYITAATLNNSDRLLKSHQANPQRLYNIFDSVYRNTDRKLGYMLRFVAADTTVVVKHLKAAYQSRFYLRGLPNGSADGPAAEMSNGYEMELWRGDQLVDDLSAYQETEVRLLFSTTPSWTLNAKFLVYVLDITDGPNTLNFFFQYQTDGVTIDSGTGSDGDLLGERVKKIMPCLETVTHDADTKYRMRFKVTTELDPTRRYAVVFVVQGKPTSGNTDNSFTNSFIRSDLAANGLPAPVTLLDSDFKGVILDYNANALTDNVETTVVDFLRCKVRVKVSSYDALAGLNGWGTWANTMRDVVFRVQDFDTGEVLWQLDFSKPVDAWTGPPNLITETDLGGGYLEYAVDLHTCYANETGLPDFGGRNIRVVWLFGISYPFESWRVDYRYEQKAAVRGYQNFGEVIESIELFDYDTGLPLLSLCGVDTVLVKVKLNAVKKGTDTWNIRVGWSLPPHGWQNNSEARPAGLRAEQAYAGNLPQLDDSAIVDLPAEYDSGGVAFFKFDAAVLAVGERARLHVIAEPIANCCSEDTLTITAPSYPAVEGPMDIVGESGTPARPLYQQPSGDYFMYHASGFWVIEETATSAIFYVESDAMFPCEIVPSAWIGQFAAEGATIGKICGGTDFQAACPSPTLNTFGAFTPGFVRLELAIEASQPAGWTYGGIQYRLNGGPWIALPFPGWGVIQNYGPYDAGTLWEGRMYNASRPDCPPMEFSVTVL